MRPNVSAIPFVPMSMKPRTVDNHGRRVSVGPVRKISAGKANFAFAEPARYKTELCRQFEELKECEYGDRCLFAHSLLELKPLPYRHPKFRTEPCLAFQEQGYCSFGPRCSFVHEKVDVQKILSDIMADVCKNQSAEEERRLPTFEKISPSVN